MPDDLRPAAPDRRTRMAILDVETNIIAAGLRSGLANGLTIPEVVQLILNQLTSLVALVEPAGARAELVKGIQESVPSMVRDHVGARLKSSGGVFLPGLEPLEPRHVD